MGTRTSATLALVTLVASTVLAAVPATEASAAPRPPAIRSLSTTSGPVAGGTRVVIRGARMKRVTGVRFDRARGTAFKRVSARKVVVTTPRHAAGPADVRLVVRRKTVAVARRAFTFTEAPSSAPTISRLSPAMGSTTGTTQVTIDGAGLRTAQVYFGDRRASVQQPASDRRLTVRAPRHQVGVVQVTVRSDGRTSGGTAFEYRAPPSITTISPDTGPLGGGDVVTVTGTGLDALTRVTFGGTAGTDLRRVTSTTLRVTTPRVTAEGPAEVVGFSPLGRTDEETNAPTYWYAPPGLGGLYWSEASDWPGFGHGGPTAISCPTTTFCAAVDEQGGLLTWRDGAWSQPQTADTSIDGYDDVTCVSAAYCLAVNGRHGYDRPSRIVRWDGSRWQQEHELAGWVQSIWCGAVGSCVATGYASYRLSGGVWRAADIGTSGDFGGDDVSCVSATWCLSLDEISGEYAVFNGTTWTIARLPGDGPRPTAVSCFAERSCLVLDEDLWGGPTTALRLTGSTWSSHPVPGRDTQARGVSCTSGGVCTVVGSETTSLAGGHEGTAGIALTIRHSDGVWGSPTTALGGALSDVSCPASEVCRAVGTKLEPSRVDDGRLVDRRYGYAVHQDAGSWGAAVAIDPDRYAQADDVTCVSSSFCMNSAGSVFDGTSWTMPPTINPYGQGMRVSGGWFGNSPEVSCTTATSCVVVGNEYDNGDDLNLFRTWESRWNGSTWTAPRTLPLMSVVDLDCQSSTWCMASGNVDGAGAVMVRDGASWGPVTRLPGNSWAGDVSCATQTSCAVTRQNGVTRLVGGTWIHDAVAPHVAHDVSCPATNFCVLTTLDDTGRVAVRTFDGTSWSALRRLAAYTGPGRPYVSVHCPAATFCTASQTSTNGFGSAASWAYVNGTWSNVEVADPGEYKWPVEATCASSDWCLGSTPWGGTSVGARR